MTMTSTYDHRIIQGAESGNFLKTIDELLQGEHDFYERVAADLGVDAVGQSPTPTPSPPRPRRSARPQPRRRSRRRSGRRHPRADRRGAAAGRAGGHLAAQGLPDPRPPRRQPEPARRRRQGRPGARAREPEPDAGADGPDPGLDPADRRRRRDAARRAAADARGLLRPDRLPVRAHLQPSAAHVAAADDRDRTPTASRCPRRRSATCSGASSRSSSSSASCRRPTWARRCSRSRASTSTVPMIDSIAALAKREGAEEVVIGMAHRGRL